MKIAFIVGCLEPGQDGVGDHVRTVAAECMRRGHKVSLLALAEPGQPAPAREPWPIFRLTAADFRADGGAAARRWIDAQAPDWASLHFVPYAFHPRGLFGGTVHGFVQALGGVRYRHLFFHEIWIGSAQGASWRQRLTGLWQRDTVRRLVQQLRPAGVHTSNGCYRAGLEQVLKRAPRVLPMFGNVPIRSATSSSAALPGVSSSAIVCGMFGTIHSNWQPDRFLADFAACAASLGRPAVLAAAGKLRDGGALFERLAAQWRGRIEFIALGEHPTDRLAEIFARFDFAVSSSPWTLIQKSGSAAALREHGLRVVVTNEGALPRFPVLPADLEPGDAGFVPYFRDGKLTPALMTKTERRAGAAEMVGRLLDDLQQWSRPPSPGATASSPEVIS